MSDPFQVVREFEAALCKYTGAKYAVAVNSCTNALMLAVALHVRAHGSESVVRRVDARPVFNIPRHTYVGVPMAILNAGGAVSWRDEDWQGGYELRPWNVWDFARRFTSRMYKPGTFQCVSFHWAKILGIQQGGAILHDDVLADGLLRQMRFDGRVEGVPPDMQSEYVLGWHCYMSPEVAAAGLVRLHHLARINPDLPKSDYPDLSKIGVFR